MTEQLCLKEKWARMGNGGPLKALEGSEKSQWLIDGIIAPNTINWLVAPPESYKTFIALDMGACIASGRPWHGLPTQKSGVLYLSAEGGDDIHIRRAAIDTAANDASEKLWIAQARPRIDDEEGFGFLCGAALDGAISYSSCKKTILQSLRVGFDYSKVTKIKYFNAEEKRRYEALGGKLVKWFDDYRWSLDKNQWNEVCEAFGYEKWNENLKTDKQKKHPYLAIIIDRDEGQYRQELRLSEYWYGLDITHRYKGYDLGYAQAESLEIRGSLHESYRVEVDSDTGEEQYFTNRSLLIIIDTYSQTSSDDEKGTVSRYIKTLRDVQDKAVKIGVSITFLVIDHTTKQGDTYMGSGAKHGDCDVMMKVERPSKGSSAIVKCFKQKLGTPFAPVRLELKPIEIEGFLDGMGRPISSLYVDSVHGSLQSRQAAGDMTDTAAATVFRLINASGSIKSEDARQKFVDLEINRDKKPESVKRAFIRALESLKAKNLVFEDWEGYLSNKSA
jgi:hypothetical protein